MALGLILLMSLLALVNASDKMYVTVSGELSYDGANPKVYVDIGGEDRAIITDGERDQFQLTDNGLKNCVKIYKGKRPTDAYVHSPTPWGDLYQRYGWNEVYRIVKPLRATVQNIHTKQELISLKMYKNSQSTPGTGKASISKTFENRLTTEWSKGGEFTVGAEVSVGAKIKVVDVGVSTSISHSSSWGHRDEHQQATSITDGAELEFVVPPNGNVYVKSEMSKTLVTVKVEYGVRLTGATAVNYKRPYNGHHFYGLDINSVMQSCGLSTELVINTVDVYFDLITGAKIEVLDSPPQLQNRLKSGQGSLDIEEIEI